MLKMIFRPATLLALVCLLASACRAQAVDSTLPTPDENNIIYVTATPLPATEAPPEPSATATPTLAPTPTVDALQLMRQGQRLSRDGYLEQAAERYRALLDLGDDIDPAMRADAAFGLGQAALSLSDFELAAAAFSLIIDEFPSDPRAPRAHFLRGDAWLGASKPEAAIVDFEQYLSLRPGLIDSYARERVADAQLALGKAETAIESYLAAIEAGRPKVALLVLREKLAQIYIDLGRHAEAVAQYDAILSVARNFPYRASIAFAAAQAALDGMDEATGRARMQAVAQDYAGSATAWQALQRLSEAQAEIDLFAQGKAAYAAGDYAAAIDAFQRYAATPQPGTIPAELYLLLGRAQRQTGDSDAATLAFQTLIDRYPEDPHLGAALLERGRTRFLAGDSPAAIEIYLAVAADYPHLDEAAGEALWRAGYLYGVNGETLRSREVFLRLAEAYPDHDLTVNGLFIAASAALQDEDWSSAEEIYARIAELSAGEDQALATLWLGRLALRRGDNTAAEEALAGAIAAAPDSFFAARAGDMLAGREPFESPASLQFSFDESRDRAAAADWLRKTFDLADDGELWRLSSALETDPRMIRGNELLAVGARDAASSEFEDLVTAVRDIRDVRSGFQLAIYLRDQGSYRESVIAAANVINAANVGSLAAPPYLARLRFPAHYIEIIQPAADARDIDPLLILALIRLESLFNTYATAAAGEKGLMQVIPSTAAYIAERLDWPDYQHSDLFQPQAGIAFGAYYLDEQLDRFDQNAVVALAAYNAGPGRAYDWNALSGGDPDLFLTTVTIDTTRKYIQYIYRNYNIYRALYGGGS